MATDEPQRPPVRAPAPRWRRVVGALVAAFVVLVLGVLLATIGTVGWVAKSASGSSWLLAQLPGVRATNPRGALVGDFAADTLVLQWPGSPLRITLQGVAWKGLTLARSGDERWLRIAIAELSAQRVNIRLPPPTPDPAKPPTDLRMPVELDITALRADLVAVDRLGDRTLRDLRAKLHLGAEGGAAHRLEGVSLAVDGLRAGGSLRIETAAPLLLAAKLDVAPETPSPSSSWRASATLDGPLATPRASATLRAARAGGAEQTLDARARLEPFERWPLPELEASTTGLDLSALAEPAPATALTGRATIRSDGLDRLATAELQLTNAEPGRWNERRLPLRTLAATLGARPDQPDTIELKSLDAQLGSEKQPAGRITGGGRWTRTAWSIDAVLAELRPSLLDSRAAPMRLSGPLVINADAVDPLLPAKGNYTLKAELSGSLADRGPARAVQLRADATLSDADRAPRLIVREVRASAGGARATLAGSATRTGPEAPWALQGKLALVDFDPLPWWPGNSDSAWRRGPHRLNANGEFDLRVPAAAAGVKGLAANLVRWQGRAAVTLTNSLLAGVPVSGEASLKTAEGGNALPSLRLVVDGNRIGAEGRLAATGPGSSDHWALEVDAPALQRLAPLVKLLAPGIDPAIAGALDANVQVDGRWPEMSTRGRLDARGLRVAGFAAERAKGSWSAGSSLASRAEADLTLTQLAFQGASLDTATLKLSGTGREHHLEARAESKLMPPAWTDWLQLGAAPPPDARGRFVLVADGALIDAAGQPGGWRGTVKQIDWRSNAASAPAWLASRDVTLEAQWAGGAPRAVLQPGSAEMLGTSLRWSRIAWQQGTAGAPAQIEAKAELDPIPVAPFLVRAQPDFGWGGDLRVGAKLDVRSAPSFAADLVVERSRGDLSVTDETGTQSLGLTDLRLAVNAANGVWTFTQALAGRTLGVAAGAVVARTSPQATWPAKGTPIEGVLELQVANLGTWGTWVPAGWRLQGALRTSASIGGRFGAPEYTGEIRGSGLGVRNFVQGVNVSDGDLAIALQGATARIERFTAKAGAGSVALTGSASLGETPRADLRLTADRFQLLGRVDRRIVASGDASLKLDRENLALDGRFRVDEGLVDFSRSDAPSLSDDVEVVRRPVRAASAPAPAASANGSGATAPTRGNALARKVTLDLRVDLGEKLQLRGRGLETGLRGELRLSAPGGRLAVAGTVRTEGGTYAAYGQKLTIDRGTLAFSGAAENPRLDIEATRPNLDVRVGVAVTGNAVNPRVRLFSEPELSELDKLSWLVLGRASDGLGRTDTALLQRAAVALLAGENGGATDQITKAIGLDELSLRQTEGDVRETVISLGKQLSRRWYVGYERGLNATTGTWQLIYRIAQRFTLRAQSGLDNSLDVIWTWRWQ